MKDFDIVIIGAATAGAYFARKMAKRGYSVKVIDQSNIENLGTKMDIFHVSKTDMNTFDIPFVKEGDKEWAFEFTDNNFSSPSNIYNIPTPAETIGLHMHDYTLLMVDYAKKAGAEFEFEAAFKEFIFENGKISGIRYRTAEGTKEVTAKTIVDCSGPSAVARRSLPNGYGIENFTLREEDMFYVILRYVRFKNPKINTFWLNAKSWYAPFSPDGRDKIIGTGATGSYARAESVAAKLDEITLHDEYELIKTEKGVTPYRRPPYSMVADNFIVTGDAACLTKPDCGEGVTSAMVMMDIAADILDKALKQNNTGKEALWEINRAYNKKQGADFSMMRAFLTKLINTVTDEEIEYCFAQKIIFNSKFFDNSKLSPVDIVLTITNIVKSLAKKGISKATIKAVLEGARLGLELRQHYINFPKTPESFGIWCKIADRLWEKVGKVN